MPPSRRARRSGEELHVPWHRHHVLARHADIHRLREAVQLVVRANGSRCGAFTASCWLWLHSRATGRTHDERGGRIVLPRTAIPAFDLWRPPSVAVVLAAGPSAPGAVERPADRRLRPRARHDEPLQHAHPRRHPVVRHRGTHHHRREDEHHPAARRGGSDARERRRRAAARRRHGCRRGSFVPA